MKKRFFFENGVPIYSMSNQLDEVLGKVMIHNGIIAQGVYERSLEIMLKEKRRQGEILLSMGAITQRQLNDSLGLQLEERLWDVFAWCDGSYHCSIAPIPPDLPNKTPIHPGYLILQGIKRGYYPKERLDAETSRLLDKVIIKTADQSRYRIDDYQPSPGEAQLLLLIDDFRSLGEIIKGSGLTMEEALPFLYALLITEVLAVKERELDPQEKVLLEYLSAEEIRFKKLNYFDRLGVFPSTDKAGVRRAYLNIVKTFHPDRFNRNSPDVQRAIHDVFTLLDEAYRTLRDDERRKVYEESIKVGKEVAEDVSSPAIIEGELQFHKGKVALHRKDYKVAIEAFEWAVKMNPNEGEYKAYLGWAVFNANPGERERAMALLREAIQLNPKEAWAHYFLGVLYRVAGDIKMAQQLFQKAIELNPYLVEAKSELRLLQARAGKAKKGFFKGLFKK